MKKNQIWGFLAYRGKPEKLLMIMKLTIILIFVFVLGVSANGISQQKLNLKLGKVTYEQLFEEIEKQTGHYVLYNNKRLNKDDEIEVNFSQMTVEEILNEILKDKDITFQIADEFIVLHPIEAEEIRFITEKDIEIKGKITDSNGEPLPGATILEEGTLNGVTTNKDGEYKLTVVGANSKIKVSFVGFTTQIIEIGNKAEINIVLIESAESLQEVVVTGYQTISKERATGSFGTVQQKYIENRIGGGDILSKLEGLTPGVMLFNTVDENGNSTQNTLIRGISTLEGNSAPLIVVDGFAIEGGINTINPNDIEQYTILKDAAAASIWGARASNGVIVITTKKGRKGKAQVTYRSSFEISPKIDMSYLKKANSETTIAYEDHTTSEGDLFASTYQPWRVGSFYSNAYGETNFPIVAWPGSLSPYRAATIRLREGEITPTEYDALVSQYKATDNTQQIKDLFLENPSVQTHYLSVQGGGQQHSYYLSANFSDSYGNYTGGNNKRLNINLQDIFKLNDKTKLTFGVNYTQAKNNFSNVNRNILYTIPYVDFIDDNGNPLNFYSNYSPWITDYINNLQGTKNIDFSPVSELSEYDNNGKSFNVRLFAAANIEVLKDLKFDLRYQFEKSSGFSSNFASQNSFLTRNTVNQFIELTEAATLVYHIPRSGGIYDETRSYNESQSLKAQFDYTKMFGEDHQIVALAGMQIQQVKAESTFGKRYGFDPSSLLSGTIDETLNRNAESEFDWTTFTFKYYNSQLLNPQSGFDLANKGPFFQAAASENRFLSYYANFAYIFKDKYSLSASLRIDESNLFGADPKNRKEPFWSIGGKWHIDKEEFFNVRPINKLSLRASYGLNGNVADRSGPFLIVRKSINILSKEFQNSILEAPNPLLKWEETRTLNLGMDLAMFNSRLSATFDLYFKKTLDVLGQEEVDPTMGFTSITRNTASIKNRGIEIRLTSRNIESKDFSWSTMLNMSFNKNEVIKVHNPITSAYSLSFGAHNEVGAPIGSMFRYEYLGLNEEGVPLIKGIEGDTIAGTDKFLISDPEALVNTGSYIPTYSIGLSNFIRYKNFELSFMFIMNGGNVMQRDLPHYGSDIIYGSVHEETMDLWQEAGDENTTNIPKYDQNETKFDAYSHYYNQADINIVKADYIKLRELRLTYDLPENTLKRSPFTFVQLVLQARNIWYWAANDYGIDPESHNYVSGIRNIPVSPSYSIGLNLKF